MTDLQDSHADIPLGQDDLRSMMPFEMQVWLSLLADQPNVSDA